LYASTNISVTPCSFVCNRNSLSKKAREKIVDLTSQLLAMPKKGNLLLRSRSGRMVTAEVAKTNPAVGVALQTLKEAYPDVNQALQKIEKAHSVTRALVDSYCRKQIKKQSRQILEAEDKEREEIEAPRGNEPASQLNQPAEAAERSMNKNGTRRSPRSSMAREEVAEAPEAAERNMKEAAAREADENGHDTMSMHSLLETLKWQNYGHEWLNKRVVRDYGANGSNQGRITKWIPADPKGPEENMALWHVMFDDDDEEDLDQGEVEEALLLEELRVGATKKTQAAPRGNEPASQLIKQAVAKKAATAALKEAAKEAAAKQEAAKQEAAKQEAAKQEAAKRAKARARAATKRKRQREKPTLPIKTADKPANKKQKTAEVVRDKQIEAKLWSWIDPLKNAYAKPKDKNIAALAALELQSVPKTNKEVYAAWRRASFKYHPDRIPADFTTSKRNLYNEAFLAMSAAKELVMKKINK
jgi:hypothetical protein